MKQINIKLMAAALIGLLLGTTSCEKEEVFNPQISAITSTNEDVESPSQGFPGDLIVAEGMQLDQMKSIGFVAGDDTVNVVFNPALNSGIAVMFNVPFDETKGSKMGPQEIVFVNLNGNSVKQPFEILQPKPIIRLFAPARPKAGETTVITGKWFQNLQSVTFAGVDADYTQLSSQEILLRLPGDATPGEVVVTTSEGSVAAHLDVDIGYNVYLVNDFDGGGLYLSNEWWNSGDITDPVVFSDVDGYDRKYLQVKWSGSTSNGWGNCEPSSGANPGIKETDQTKVFFLFEVYCVSAAGTSMQVQIDDGGTVWAHNYTFTAEEVGKWITVEMSSAEFGRGYDPSNQTGDMDLASISKIKVAINGWSGVVPSTVRIDNMRFHGYY